MAPSSAVFDTALAAVRFFGPAALVLIALSVAALRADKASGTDPSPIIPITIPVITPRRGLITALLSLAAISYLLDGTVVVLRAVLWKDWEGAEGKWTGVETADVLGLVAFGLLIIIGTWKDAKGIAVWTSKRVKFFAWVALLFEIALVVLLGITLSDGVPRPPPHIPENPPPPGIFLSPFLHISLSSFRLLLFLILVPVLSRPVRAYVAYSAASDATAVESNGHAQEATLVTQVGESSGLLAPQPKYGTFLPPPSTTPSVHSSTPSPTEAGITIKPQPVKEKGDDESWATTFSKIRRLLPYLWPHKSIWLQFLAVLCMVILLISRVVNLLQPLVLRELIADLEGGAGFNMGLLLLFVSLRFLQGSGGLNAVRDALWAPVMQYSDREMSQLSFDHLLNLSLAFHTRRKTGEILRVLDRGAAINHVFEVLLFNIIPTFLDIAIALGAFFYFFGWVLSAVVAAVMIAYIAASVVLTRWRTKLRRAMNDRDIITRGIHTDCLLNYDTVKYFGGEQHEGQRYKDAIAQYQALEFRVILSLNLLNFVQNFIISGGLLVGSLIVAYRISHAAATAADFVFFITYLAQLYGPLNMLGYIYRTINQNLIDTEKLLNLLNEPTEVNDRPGAPDLVLSDGVIEFEHVSFSYDNKTTALHDVSFTIPKGHSVALVGESGGGKSTILRLLFRQYDLKEGQGRILIDGQDIREITQASLRKAIGVVPQDSVLFNDSIGYNIGYGKLGASQEEIEAAASAAQMHERILSFPDGYSTRVGERGVRLSGGEKQRVAIARTFLKNSPILALDEATSALDTATEKDIQKALQNLLEGRSSISIAHRLSTIASADIILVLKDGHIVESGSHKELIAQGGYFAAMWAKQITSDSAQGPSFASSSEGVETTGYEITHDAMPSDATVVPQVIPQLEGVPFLAPGHQIVDHLPPTEAEIQAAKAPSVKAPSTREVPAPSQEIAVEEAPSADVALNSPTDVKIPLADEAPQPTETAPIPERTQDVTLPPLSPPVAFPTSAPVAFPSSDNSSSRRQSIAPTGSIQFAELNEPPRDPSTTAEKEEDKEPKRKRISSQNFRRLARTISFGRKGSSSGAVPTPGDTTPTRQGSIDLGTSGRSSPSTPPTSGAAATSGSTPVGSDTEGGAPEKRRLLPRRLSKKPTRQSSTSGSTTGV